jgi:hypothetical protein
MNVLLVYGIWIAIAILTAFIARFIVVKVAKNNGYCSNTMPMKYHIWAIGAYFTVVYPALYILNYIF